MSYFGLKGWRFLMMVRSMVGLWICGDVLGVMCVRWVVRWRMMFCWGIIFVRLFIRMLGNIFKLFVFFCLCYVSIVRMCCVLRFVFVVFFIKRLEELLWLIIIFVVVMGCVLMCVCMVWFIWIWLLSKLLSVIIVIIVWNMILN